MPVNLEILHAQSETQKEKDLSGHFRKKTRGLKQENVIMEAAIWRLRFQHAYTTVLFFELAALHHGSHLCYYTASGLGPADRRCKDTIGDIPIEYKHTPQEWIPIWNNVMEKLRKKVKESNEQKKIWGV